MNTKISMLACVILLLLTLTPYVFSVSTSVTMFPSSNSYVLRTYTLNNTGLFNLEPSEIKDITPSDLSIFTDGADVYLTYYREVNKTKQVQKSLEDMLNESVGSHVSVYTDSDRNYTGVLQWYDGKSYIGLVDTTGEHVIPLNHIVELLIPNVSAYKEENSTEYQTTIFGNSFKPSSSVSLGYAKSDLSWSINYDLVMNGDRGELTQYAELVNDGNESYDDAKLTLTMLTPNFVGSRRYNYYPYLMKAVKYEAGLPGGSVPSFSVVSQAQFWSYVASKPITLPPHSSQKLTIFTSTADCERKYIWDTHKGDVVYRVYNLTNTREEVLPSGTVRVFEGNSFIGEDSVGMLASGKDAELFVSNVPQLSVEKSELSDKTSGLVDRYKHVVDIRLKIKNYGKEAKLLEVRDYIPQYDDFAFVRFSKQPDEIDGNKAVWKVDVDAGSERIIEYTYTYTSTY